jgi:hypothetical protein
MLSRAAHSHLHTHAHPSHTHTTHSHDALTPPHHPKTKTNTTQPPLNTTILHPHHHPKKTKQPNPPDDLEFLIEKCVDIEKADYAVVTGVQIHNCESLVTVLQVVLGRAVGWVEGWVGGRVGR